MSTRTKRVIDQKLSVERPSRLVDRMAQDCGPLQFLREFTWNGVEATLRAIEAGRIKEGHVVIHLDNYEGHKKLCFTDNGDGMTGQDMCRYINRLASTKCESEFGNYGVGAKISALPRNPFGVWYKSWPKPAQGEAVLLIRDENGEYGLNRIGDEGEYVAEVTKWHTPRFIDMRKGTGTQVTLLGRSTKDDTASPVSYGLSGNQWVRRALNSRFFAFPDKVFVRAQDYSENGRGELRPVKGQKYALDACAELKGSVKLTGAIAHFWCITREDTLPKPIREDGKAVTSRASFTTAYELAGHVGLLWKNELYDIQKGTAAYAQMQRYGLTFGNQQMVLYIEPTDDDLTTNTARTQLLKKGVPLKVENWADEFRHNLPKSLIDWMDGLDTQRDKRDRSVIKDRLKPVVEMFRKQKRFIVSRRGGDALQRGAAGPEVSVIGIGDVTPPEPRQPRGESTGGGGGGGGGGGTTEPQTKGTGVVLMPLPGMKPRKVQEVTIEDDIECVWVADQHEGKAALFTPETRKLLINQDFVPFLEWVDHFASLYPPSKKTKEAIMDIVKVWWEQTLIEAIMLYPTFAKKAHLEPRFPSPEYLTVSTIGRYHLDKALKREIYARFQRPMKETPTSAMDFA